jgi:hypothetical protein
MALTVRPSYLSQKAIARARLRLFQSFAFQTCRLASLKPSLFCLSPFCPLHRLQGQRFIGVPVIVSFSLQPSVFSLSLFPTLAHFSAL